MPKGWRKIVVDGVEYRWRVQNATVLFEGGILEGPTAVDGAELLGLTNDQYERGIWKRYISIRPEHIANYIRKHINPNPQNPPPMPSRWRKDRIVFLDFDGVINSDSFQQWLKAEPPHRRPGYMVVDDEYAAHLDPNALDREAIERLNRLLLEGQASVVISSTWRLDMKLGELKALLRKYGFLGKIIGKTPYLGAEPRGHEIHKWLKSYKHPVESFVIVDDDNDMEPWHERLVQTSWGHGLLDDHVAAAIAILNTPLEEA